MQPDDINFIFLFSDSASNQIQIEHENQNLRLLFETYQILFENVIDVDSSTGNSLSFETKTIDINSKI
jgi:hypothetical protein